MPEKASILLVEDDDVDAMLIERLTGKRNWDADIVRARNGQEALDILRSDTAPRLAQPFMVLLDLNMPVMGGLEFLEELRSDASLAGTIVFVLTTSAHPRDVEESYRHNVAGYVVKDTDGEQFDRCLDMLEAYQEVVHFPENA